MNQYTVVNLPPKLRSRDLHWAVGFLEGEGCFASSGSTQSVSVYQSGSTETLEKLQKFFGGSILKKPPSGTSKFIKTKKQRYEWRVYGARARNVIQQVYPYMSTRRKTKIDKVLSKGDPDWSKA